MATDKRRKYFWQGKPIKIEFGSCIVKASIETQQWHDYECYLENQNLQEGRAMIEAIRMPLIQICANAGKIIKHEKVSFLQSI